jgi:hypothetical protein
MRKMHPLVLIFFITLYFFIIYDASDLINFSRNIAPGGRSRFEKSLFIASPFNLSTRLSSLM